MKVTCCGKLFQEGAAVTRKAPFLTVDTISYDNEEEEHRCCEALTLDTWQNSSSKYNGTILSSHLYTGGLTGWYRHNPTFRWLNVPEWIPTQGWLSNVFTNQLAAFMANYRYSCGIK